MRRREFITLLGGAAAAWPLAARAQQLGKLPTIGFLGDDSFGPKPMDLRLCAAAARTWLDRGADSNIEFGGPRGATKEQPTSRAEFTRLGVNVIVTGGTAPILAAKRVTSPSHRLRDCSRSSCCGLVGVAQPGGNVTGFSVLATDLAGKKIELLREVVPGLHRLAVMANVASLTGTLQLSEVQTAARTLGLEVIPVEIRRAEDLAPAIETLKGRADALYVANEPLVTTHRARINALALSARLPTLHGAREHIEVGGLISYAPNFPDLYRRAAEYVDKILRGAKPGDLPVEQPTKFDLIVNLTTAKALGLTIPESFLLRADEVIE